MKRHNPSVVYNVVICGYSIGMTFDYLEAKTWLQKSAYPGNDKRIITVPYRAAVS